MHLKSALKRAFSTARPSNIGIVAMDTYFPKLYVSQSDLEKHDGIAEGKYVIGLGQDNMAFCGEREDINSVALSAVSRLLRVHDIDPKSIGRVEVGTETIVDKSKSVKTALMELFAPSGNTNIEGIDTTNACYGGTSALFNALQWMESSYWDGRYALVVAGDIAVYEKGPARPTGGAGCVAMLVGPKAPLVFDRGVRGTYMEHAWDFYKPQLSSEYPTVDGKLSNDCYIRALDRCFAEYKAAWARAFPGDKFTLDKFDYCLFHSPYTKLVQKSWARMQYDDFLARPDAPEFAGSPLLPFKGSKAEETYNDRDLMKASTDATAASYKKKVVPSLTLSRQLGNAYCGSLYLGLQSLVDEADLRAGQRVGLFSYGSGLAATLFSLTVQGSTQTIRQRADIKARLAQRRKATAQEFTDVLQQREDTHNTVPFRPTKVPEMFPNSYYLDHIDEKHRRHYSVFKK